MSDYIYLGGDLDNDKKYLTADDETPNCGRCDHFGDDFKCDESCGANKGWYGYIRSI